MIEQYFPADIPGYSPNLSAAVDSRMEAEGQAQGVEVGDFVIRPLLNESVGYNSDTLGRPNTGSVEFENNASFNAISDWKRDALNFSVDVNDQRFPNSPAANNTSWSAGAGGSLDLGNDTATLAYLHQSLNLAATSIGAISVETPVPYSVDDVRASYLKLTGRLSLTLTGEYENYGFGNGGAGDQQNYTTLSHHVELARLTARFEESPGEAIVLIVQPSFAQFVHDSANDYTDISAFGGLDMRGDRIIQYRILAGLESRSFSQDSTRPVTTPTFELDATWTPEELDTITVTGVHRLDDPISPFARDQDLLDGRIELDHELRANVFLTGYAEAARTVSSSSIGGSSLSQTQLSAGFSAVWIINRHFSGTFSYGFTTSHAPAGAAIASASSGQSFCTNSIMIGIQLYD